MTAGDDSKPVSGGQVLVIEDDPAIGRLVNIILTSAGFKVTLVTDGASGLASVREEPPCLVLLDLTLPGLPGRDTLTALVEWGRAPVVVLTGVDSSEALIACLEAGAFDVAIKPFDPDDLEDCVKLALGAEVTRATRQPPVRSGVLTLDFASCRLSSGLGPSPQLSLSEWRILETLAAHAGKTVLYQEILGRVWGPGFRMRLDFLEAWMARLKKKVTLSEFHGVGYALVV